MTQTPEPYLSIDPIRGYRGVYSHSLRNDWSPWYELPFFQGGTPRFRTAIGRFGKRENSLPAGSVVPDATCSGLRPCRTPEWTCTCGYYVLKSPRRYAASIFFIEVECYGTVVEHENYYRVQTYKPIGIILPRYCLGKVYTNVKEHPYYESVKDLGLGIRIRNIGKDIG